MLQEEVQYATTAPRIWVDGSAFGAFPDVRRWCDS